MKKIKSHPNLEPNSRYGGNLEVGVKRKKSHPKSDTNFKRGSPFKVIAGNIQRTNKASRKKTDSIMNLLNHKSRSNSRLLINSPASAEVIARRMALHKNLHQYQSLRRKSSAPKQLVIKHKFSPNKHDEMTKAKKTVRYDVLRCKTRISKSCHKKRIQRTSISHWEGEVAEDDINEIVQMYRDLIAMLAKSSKDPEKFFKPETSNRKLHFVDRKLNVQKFFNYFVDYMDSYYDLKHGHNVFVDWRQTLNDELWTTLTYIIPLLCKKVVEDVLKNEHLVVHLEPDCLVFGDIHGNLNDLYYIHKHFITMKKYAHHKFVFLGDYVDRGTKSLEAVVFLMLLKSLQPKRFVLLRGNHEVEKVNRKYGFKESVESIYREYRSKNKEIDKVIYRSVNMVFNNLPVAAYITFKNHRPVFCCHGGIPNESYNKNKPWTIEELKKLSTNFKPHNLIPRRKCPPEQKALSEILWNDPVTSKSKPTSSTHSPSTGSKKQLFYNNKPRGGHCSKFTQEAMDRFLQANNLRLVIRGHQYKCSKDKGYHYNFPNHKTLTVFSSSNYCGVEENTTGMVVVTEDSCEPTILRTLDESIIYHVFNHYDFGVDPKTKKTICVPVHS